MYTLTEQVGIISIYLLAALPFLLIATLVEGYIEHRDRQHDRQHARKMQRIQQRTLDNIEMREYIAALRRGR